jgi:hypothetical protein
MPAAAHCLQVALTRAVDRELNHGTDGTRSAAILFISVEMTSGIYPHTKQGRILLARWFIFEQSWQIRTLSIRCGKE